jgi:hypothetical protein
MPAPPVLDTVQDLPLIIGKSDIGIVSPKEDGAAQMTSDSSIGRNDSTPNHRVHGWKQLVEAPGYRKLGLCHGVCCENQSTSWPHCSGVVRIFT